MILFIDVGLVPTFWQRHCQTTPCLPKLEMHRVISRYAPFFYTLVLHDAASTFWQKPSQPPPCLPKMKNIFIRLWCCPWQTSAVWCRLLMLGWFQLSDKSLPNLHRVCPRSKLSLSFYDIVIDTLVPYDAAYWCWVCSSFLTKAFPTCPKWKTSLSCYDLVLDRLVLHDAVYWCWVCSNFLTKAFPTSTVSAQDVNCPGHFLILSLTH